MELFLLILGLLIIAVNFMDFFHTTLSGQGFGAVSGKLNRILGKLLLKFRHSWLFRYSGLIHLMTTSLTWLLLLIAGCYLIFTSSDFMVVDSQTKVPASLAERFYYTTYVISTLGIGDYVPGTDLSRILTGITSFSGFILLTTALTYFLSVVSSVQQKRLLAFYIAGLGKDINQLYQAAIAPKDFNAISEDSGSLAEKILQNSSCSMFFPITQYYLTSEKDASLELQLVRLREVLTILNYQYEEKSAESLQAKNILAAIGKYLSLGTEGASNFKLVPEELRCRREFWQQNYALKFEADPERDRALNAALKSAGWEWKDVYNLG